MDNADGEEPYVDDECIDLDDWDSAGTDEDNLTNNDHLSQYSAISHC